MIVIIGAGISGLTLGYYLKKSGYTDFKILERDKKVGGKAQSLLKNGYHLELGPNTLFTTPELIELIQDLNLQSNIL